MYGNSTNFEVILKFSKASRCSNENIQINSIILRILPCLVLEKELVSRNKQACK